ncbi:MAG: glycoside hydrolase, partial [Phycisphaerae bacterium]|nr:glycoside hydrolase [Phycisphaerae bacterium]
MIQVSCRLLQRLSWEMGLLAVAVLAMGSSAPLVSAQGPEDALRRGFESPPDRAKPRVWWHWMNGNITKEGIRADLEWMKRVGIGGFQNFDAAMNSPQVVENRLVYMTPEWKEAFRYATTLADQLGLEMAIAGSPGWSESGGPWVPPAQAMKKFVWSETWVDGGQRFTGFLARPPSTIGAYQNLTGGRTGFGAEAVSTKTPEPFYADAAVVALRMPDNDPPMVKLQPKVTSSGGSFSLAALTDGDVATATLLPAAPAGEKAWIQFEFAQPQAVRGLTLIAAGGGRGFGGRGGGDSGQAVEVSDEGQEFRVVASIPAGARSIGFPGATARFFRVTFRTQASGGFGGAARGMAAPAPGTRIAELVLRTAAWVHRVEEKAAFSPAVGLTAQATPEASPAHAVRKEDVVDLTSKMRDNGSLDWTPPAGQWLVLRLGYSLIGSANHPASPEATGLEVDKLSRTAVKAYFDNYLNQYQDATGGLMGRRGLQYVITDSWEAGQMNWTDDMIAEFNHRRSYDMRPWLPVLVGYVVESPQASDRFLWDFRKTIGDLTVEAHYDQLTALLRERGMARYSESHESGRALVADGMEVKRTAAVPMSAMWVGRAGGHPSGVPAGYAADIRESASVAHIYGQNLVAAESLTAGSGAWSWSPETLKPTADAELSQGLNRFVIHTSVHQPVHDKIPGLSLGPFGQWFTRHETWAEVAQPWITYLARSSYMLQQGQFVADVLYYYGEDTNITALFGSAPPDLPEGYNFDYASSDVVLNRLAVKDGCLTTATGMSYRVLALDGNTRHMPLAVLRRIRDLVNAGATVAGPKPMDSPSLSDDQAEFKTIADQLWGEAGGERTVGKGRLYAGQTAVQALTALQVSPDFEYSKPQSDTILLFVHRALPDGEIYWVNNRRGRAETLEATFRVTGKAPEIWHPDTGWIEPAAYRMADGRTTVPLSLDPMDAVFVVLRERATATSRTLPARTETPVCTGEGAWDSGFQPDRGAPAKGRL